MSRSRCVSYSPLSWRLATAASTGRVSTETFDTYALAWWAGAAGLRPRVPGGGHRPCRVGSWALPMTMQRFVSGSREQAFLLPPDMRGGWWRIISYGWSSRPSRALIRARSQLPTDSGRSLLSNSRRVRVAGRSSHQGGDGNGAGSAGLS